ncbi:MAG: 4Fe-4S binding protein [Gammaproteobacteria bacterium]|nr:4Fe-4S binding protein [Gammaproteobacteria bacterium]
MIKHFATHSIASYFPGRETLRAVSQLAFYLLFLTAPILDIFRFDLSMGQFIILGHSWIFGLESSEFQCFDTATQVKDILLNFILPVILLVVFSIFIAWKYGRIYCGWLCPHFSVVETINRLMLKYTGRVTLWEPAKLKEKGRLGLILVFCLCLTTAFIWSFTFLSYVIDPKVLAMDLYHLRLSLGPALALLVMTALLTFDFFFARHLFCQYGCSYGMLQSFAWMANRKAMVIGFDKSRAHICQSCDNECDKSCPMRLPVRSIKRAKFSCTQCGVCLTACDEVQKNLNSQEIRLIQWVDDEQAIAVDRQAASFNIKRLKKSK